MRTLPTICAAVWLAAAGPSFSNAQTIVATSNQATVIVKGVVFDSLTMTPASKATVWVAGGTQTAVTDERGRFEIEGVPRGTHFLAFSNVAFDSLGLGMLGARIDASTEAKSVRLTTPSFRTVWNSLCTSSHVTSGTDSGIVWGTIRDADSDSRLHGAAANFSWYDMRVAENKRMAFNELGMQARSDSAGNYYACGLPSDIKISSQATGTRSASGAVEFVIGNRRLNRVDLLVSQDMVLAGNVLAGASADSTPPTAPKGTSILRGRVFSKDGKPVENAMITVGSADSSARTNKDGEFVFTELPAGSQVVNARVIGFPAAAALVDLRPNLIANVELRMPDAQTLATLNVRAERVAGRDKMLFDERQKIEFGITLTERDIAARFNVPSVMRGIPRIEVGGRIYVITGLKRCIPVVYLDGIITDQDQVLQMPADKLRAVEVYAGSLRVPFGFEGKNCGTILFWTKMNPRW